MVYTITVLVLASCAFVFSLGSLVLAAVVFLQNTSKRMSTHTVLTNHIPDAPEPSVETELGVLPFSPADQQLAEELDRILFDSKL